MPRSIPATVLVGKNFRYGAMAILKLSGFFNVCRVRLVILKSSAADAHIEELRHFNTAIAAKQQIVPVPVSII